MSDQNKGNGSLVLGGGVGVTAIVTLLLERTGNLGELAGVLQGPGGAVLLAVAAIISSVAFTFRGMVIPARNDAERMKEERDDVREKLETENKEKWDAFETKIQELSAKVLDLTEKLARAEARLEMYSGATAVRKAPPKSSTGD